MAANAIGVFLGLGFPWLVAAIYWDTVGKDILRGFTRFLGRPQHRICGALGLNIFYGGWLLNSIYLSLRSVKGDDVHDRGSLWTSDTRGSAIHEVFRGGRAWWPQRPKIRLLCDSLWPLRPLSSHHFSQFLWGHAKPFQYIKQLLLAP